MSQFVQWSNFSKIAPYAELFRQGIVVTVLLSVFTVAIGFCIALILALMRMSNVRPFRALGLDKDGHMREGGPLVWISRFNPLSFLATAYVEILNSGAYLCEIIRAGIQSIDGGQTEAARSLGLSQTQNLRYIIFPQALKNILPAIANEFVVIIKESAITYTIGVQDIMSAVNAVKGATFIIVEPLLVATAIYFCLCFPTSKIIAYFERRMSRGDKR